MVIPDSVTSIGSSVFRLCSDLTNVTIGNSVTTIGYRTFEDCGALTCIYFKGDAPELDTDVFNGVNANATVYYIPGTAGWGATYGGLPTVEWLSVADVDMDGDVNLWDFATFAAAWQAVDGVDDEYNPLCDISDPVDGVIDADDLSVFAGEWLITPCP